LLATQLEKHQEVLRALTAAKNSGDMHAFTQILQLRSTELAEAINQVRGGSYSLSDKQKMLDPLEQEKNWADSSIAALL